jgi:hypothetical protein
MLERVPILAGDGSQNDRHAIRYLLKGGVALCTRTQRIIYAPTLRALPVGSYRLEDLPSKD